MRSEIRISLATTRNEKNQPWTATLWDYEGGDPIGWGNTPDEAIEDLKAEIEWRNESA